MWTVRTVLLHSNAASHKAKGHNSASWEGKITGTTPPTCTLTQYHVTVGCCCFVVVYCFVCLLLFYLKSWPCGTEVLESQDLARVVNWRQHAVPFWEYHNAFGLQLPKRLQLCVDSNRKYFENSWKCYCWNHFVLELQHHLQNFRATPSNL